MQHYDLTDPSHLESLVVFIQENNDIAMVWMAPPCSTASKARERPLKHLEKMGMSIPKPLRSKEQPDQLDGLGGINKIKTETANMWYDAVHVIATTCHRLGIFVVVENPGNSHFWATSPIARLLFFFLPCRARHDSSDGRSRLHTIRTQFKRNKRSRPWGKQTKQATKQQNTTPKPNKKPQTRQPAKPSPKIEITQVKR